LRPIGPALSRRTGGCCAVRTGGPPETSHAARAAFVFLVCPALAPARRLTRRSVLAHPGGLEWGSTDGQVAAVVGAEVVAAGEGFSTDETASATRGPTSGSLALMAGSRPPRGDTNKSLPMAAFAPGPSLLLQRSPASHPEFCRPAGPPMWRLFIPAGVEP
jgi:hypothetical protein